MYVVLAYSDHGIFHDCCTMGVSCVARSRTGRWYLRYYLGWARRR